MIFAALRGTLTKVLLCLVLLIGGLFLMRTIYDVRIEELGQNLETNTDKTMALRSLGLIAKFKLIQSRIKNGETIALLKKEAQTSYAGTESLLHVDREKLPLAYGIGLHVVNFVNYVAGGTPIGNRKKSSVELLVEEAYLLELRRNFAEAVTLYDKLLEKTGSANADLSLFARLHRGYCFSFSEARKKAIADFKYVISNSPPGEYRLTAEVLLAYVEEFERRSYSISLISDAKIKASAYFDIGSYGQAIATLENEPEKKADVQTTYILGRSYEESGNSGKALEKYRIILRENPRSKYALSSNRRIYAMGSMYGNNADLVAESSKNATSIVPDADLLKETKRIESLAFAVSDKRRALIAEIQQQSTVDLSPTLLAEKTAPPAPKEKEISDSNSSALTVNKGVMSPTPVSRNNPRNLDELEPQTSDPALLSRTERKAIIQREAEIDELLLADGNRLWGIILKEDSDLIDILTVMGKVSIRTSHIVSRKKKDSAAAFKPRS